VVGGRGCFRGFNVGVTAYSDEPDEQLVEKSYLFLGELRYSCGSGVIVSGYQGLMRCVVDKALDLGFTATTIRTIEETERETEKLLDSIA
jgi:predicted Rossmann-fold nucleotide-binding protein